MHDITAALAPARATAGMLAVLLLALAGGEAALQPVAATVGRPMLASRARCCGLPEVGWGDVLSGISHPGVACCIVLSAV